MGNAELATLLAGQHSELDIDFKPGDIAALEAQGAGGGRLPCPVGALERATGRLGRAGPGGLSRRARLQSPPPESGSTTRNAIPPATSSSRRGVDQDVAAVQASGMGGPPPAG